MLVLMGPKGSSCIQRQTGLEVAPVSAGLAGLTVLPVHSVVHSIHLLASNILRKGVGLLPGYLAEPTFAACVPSAFLEQAWLLVVAKLEPVTGPPIFCRSYQVLRTRRCLSRQI